ncbi:uncharacterized protein SPSK_05688 [Sporothrix schenckii 1099-18]|uniref:Uncharacterized protein n=1 Tax=Sporothrix schenckii 1099-18 TaxID=1397361 RepID=A0A0F2LTL9_SPOSC|nr:uncharacterized protein SPSK_05688 [Sporothrix schenckii 1099-18]KJR80827.1 hypothetical protein SPSK_05688 [Sporothrix schenckii 1099-18]
MHIIDEWQLKVIPKCKQRMKLESWRIFSRERSKEDIKQQQPNHIADWFHHAGQYGIQDAVDQPTLKSAFEEKCLIGHTGWGDKNRSVHVVVEVGQHDSSVYARAMATWQSDIGVESAFEPESVR